MVDPFTNGSFAKAWEQNLKSKPVNTAHNKKYHAECNSILKVIEHVEVELCFSSKWGLFF